MARPSLNPPQPPAHDPRAYQKRCIHLLKQQITDCEKYRRRKIKDRDPAETKRLEALAQTAAIKLLDLMKSGQLNDDEFDAKKKRHHEFLMNMLDMDEKTFLKELQRHELIGTFTPAAAKIAKARYYEIHGPIQGRGSDTGSTEDGSTETGDDADFRTILGEIG